MKKIIRMFIFVLSIVSIFSICGCNYDQNDYVDENASKENIYSSYLEKYNQTVSVLKFTANGLLSESFEADFNNGKFTAPDDNFSYEWGAMLVDATEGLDKHDVSSFGYILKDINSDNIPELFFVREDYTVLAIFTLNESSPKLLGAFWSRNKVVILDSGDIYTLTNSGAAYFEYTIYTIKNNQLSVVKRFGMNGDYYKTMNDEISVIGKSEFEEILEANPFSHGQKWKENSIYSLA